MLVARRKGGSPVELASAAEGLQLELDEATQMRGLPKAITVQFRHGGAALALYVTNVVVLGEVMALQQFQSTYQVSDQELGRWLRAAIEIGLDMAERTR